MERIERSSVVYRTTALPLSYIGLERMRRIELRYSDWRPDAQPIGHTRMTIIQMSKSYLETHLYPLAPKGK
jgi:hypothetical protein